MPAVKINHIVFKGRSCEQRKGYKAPKIVTRPRLVWINEDCKSGERVNENLQLNIRCERIPKPGSGRFGNHMGVIPKSRVRNIPREDRDVPLVLF